MNRMRLFTIFSIFLAGQLGAQERRSPPHERGSVILRELQSMPWARDWKDAELAEIRRVEQKPDLAQPTNLPPVWYAKIKQPSNAKRKSSSYLMWEASGDGGLIEFALDGKLGIDAKTENAQAIENVPALQQFAIPGDDEKPVASGCVPTSAASVVSYWAGKKFPQWDGEQPEEIATRLRARMKMKLFPDTDGFTQDGMTLVGAFPHELLAAIRADAEQHGVAINCSLKRFSMKRLKAEIKESRPALVSCLVRLPHKPQLSWGHEVAAVGWAEVGGQEFVGVLDNFFPTSTAGTIRWIRADAFNSMITLREAESEAE